MVTVINTKAQWLIVAENLRSGQVRFSTGSQERNADALADYIETEVYGAGVPDHENVELDLDYDGALSVTQAAGWARIDVGSLFRGFM